MAERADSGISGSVRDLLEKLVPFGSTLSRERIRDAVDGLVSQGKLSPDAADELVDELTESVRSAGQRLSDRASGAVSGLAAELGFVRERQVEELELRVAQLEHRLRLLEAAFDDARTPPRG